MYPQSTTLLMDVIMSLTKTNWPRISYFVRWYVDSTAKATAKRIPINRFASSKYVSCRLYVRTRLPNTLCSLSMVAFACGFPGEGGLFLIPYSFSIKIF